VTADYLAALEQTGPMLTRAMLDEFTEDIESIARL
jgi:hypothetical protein